MSARRMCPRSTDRRLSRLYEPTKLERGPFPEFLVASWRAGVVRHNVDFAAGTVTHYGCNGGPYLESYHAVDVK